MGTGSDTQMSNAAPESSPQRSGILLCLVGPAGGGKTTIAKQLIAQSQSTSQRQSVLQAQSSLEKSISVTSRPMRAGEVEGESYHFVTREEFERRVAANLFFEWEEVHGNLYGTLRAPLDNAVASGRDLILDIDIRGALNLRRHYTRHVVTVFVLPPSVQVLKDRIIARGSLREGELERRLATAATEYARMVELHRGKDGHEYLVINADLGKAVAAAQGVLDAERQRFHRFSLQLVERICHFGSGVGKS